MRAIYILPVLTLLAFASSGQDKDQVRLFYKQTDVVNDELKGKVRSVIKYNCSLDSSHEYCSVERIKYNERGFVTERTDSSKSGIYSNKYFYNGDGLLIRRASTSNFIGSFEETFAYSIPDRRKIKISHQDNSVDSSITLYDRNGNEIQYSSKTNRSFNEYDRHGFLVLSKSVDLTHSQDTLETRYINDAQGRRIKVTKSDGFVQKIVRNKDGNVIQQAMFEKSEKLAEWFTGYCEFDKNGNCLKAISMNPQTGDMIVHSLVIEYY